MTPDQKPEPEPEERPRIVLGVKRPIYDDIKRGDKKIERRRASPYWRRIIEARRGRHPYARIKNNWNRVHFREIEGIRLAPAPNSHRSLTGNGKVYEIRLGRRIHVRAHYRIRRGAF